MPKLTRVDPVTRKRVAVTQKWIDAQVPIMVYDPHEDVLVPITQQWVENVSARLQQLAALRSSIHNMTAPGSLLEGE